jgi:general secretion pathway protein D
MPINKRFRLKNLPVRARLLALAPLTSLLLTTPLLHAADPGNLAAKELAHRGQRVIDARNLLVSGDEAYQAGKWKDAVEAYSKARDLLPSSPVTAELRDAATERLALGSIEYAKDLSRLGDVAGAKAVMDRVLADGVAPHHAGALAMRAKLDDPIRTNPALTKEHTADVEEVRLLLYKAEGAYNLGKFDEAKTVYEDVLRTDPYNTAARRGMEQVSQAKMNYTHAANDETRAEMLAQVDEAWERHHPSEHRPR